jgi:hypothetical protein
MVMIAWSSRVAAVIALVALGLVAACSKSAPKGATVSALRVVSMNGPAVPGVFVDTSVRGLLTQMANSSHQATVACHPSPCWDDRSIGVEDLGVAFRPYVTSCEQVTDVRAAPSSPSMITLNVQAHPVCTRGSGAAAMGTAVLVELPPTTVSQHGPVTVAVMISFGPGKPAVRLGQADLTPR